MDLSKGSAVHIKEVVRALHGLGCEVTLVASGTMKGVGIPICISLCRKPFLRGGILRVLTLVWMLIRLFALARAYLSAYDIVYARDYHVAVVCLLPAMLFRKRLVYEINGLASEEFLMKGGSIPFRAVAQIIREFEGLAARGADRVVAVTEGLKRYLVADLGADKSKIAVVPNGVDTRLFSPMDDTGSLDSLRSELGIGKRQRVVLFVGNLAPWQGVDTLLDSVPIVLDHIPKVRFLVVGDGVLRPHIEARIRRMNLETSVLVTGMVSHDQVPWYINLAHVCVSPFVQRRNDQIGLSPLKIYEYMACGKAVVSSRIAGLEMIEKKKTGVLVEPENPRRLAEEITGLLLHPRRRARMGERGFMLAQQEFSWNQRACEVLQAIVEDQGGSAFPPGQS
jgi:glycosyltransferase involved in cell wall biosynthesis